MTAPTFWRCLTCHEHGTTTGTESGADVKHMKATKHATVTSIRGGVLYGATKKVGRPRKVKA